MNPISTSFFLLTSLSALVATAADARSQDGPRFLLLGRPAARPIELGGIAGRLALDPVWPCPGAFGAGASAQLRALRAARELAPLGEVHYQTLSRDPDTGALRLSDLMRLPLGTDDEATSAVAVHRGGSRPASSEIVYPTVKTIEITLSEEPEHTLWTRYLSFTNYLGSVKRVPIAFARKAGLTWSGTVDAAGLAALQSLADTGNRSYWDNMSFENRGGSTELRIARLEVIVHYEKSSSYEEDIPLVDCAMNRTLAAGTSSIDLDTFAAVSRRAWSGISIDDHLVVKTAANDFGKSGSDGADGYGANPKFGGRDNLLCSEFVSWYFYAAGLRIGDENFRDITSTSQIDAAFHAEGRRYDYNNYYQEFRIAGGSTRYTPQPGDFLARRYDGDYQHSMIVLSWDNATKTMTVINGPWPVTLRRVAIQDLEEDGYDFRVGKIR